MRDRLIDLARIAGETSGMKKALLALALMSATTALLAAPTNPPTVPPVGASVQLATPDGRLAAAEAKSEALEDRLIAVEAKAEAAESAYSRFEVITGLVGLLITLVVAAFGIATYLTAVNKVKAETSELKEQLRRNIGEAAQNARSQREEFERQKGEIEALLAGAGEDARQLSEHTVAGAASAAEISAMLARAQSAPPDSRAADLQAEDQAQIEAAAKNLEDKPQSEWSLADFRLRIAQAALVRKDWAKMLRLAEELASARADDPEAIAFSLFQQAYAHGQLERPERAIELYSELAERFGSSEVPAFQEQVAAALFNKGVRLGTLGRIDDAIAAYDDVLARSGSSEVPAVQELVAKALVNKRVRLGTLGRSEDEIAIYDEVLARIGSSEVPALQELVAGALGNKGVVLGTLGRSDDAIAAYDEVLARFGTSDAPALQEQVAKALFNTACAHARAKRVKASIAMLEKWAARIGGVDCQKIAGDADFDAVRDRPSFKAFLRKHGCG